MLVGGNGMFTAAFTRHSDLATKRAERTVAGAGSYAPIDPLRR
jgi:hypothetical protein